MNMEETVCGLLLHSGNARRKAFEALNAAESLNFEVAKGRLQQAEQELSEGHRLQTQWLQSEAKGDLPFLMIHAQGHLMTAQSELHLIRRLIRCYQEMDRLSRRMDKLEETGDLRMNEITVTIPNRNGLHARPAALLVQEAGKYTSQIRLIKGDRQADAKSLLGVMSLSIRQGEKVLLRAEGDDAEEALKGLEKFLSGLTD